MKIGIIQPGRLGDLIILLPAAKYLHDQGNEVYWPIFSNYIDMFEDVIDYVNFIPVSNDIYTCVKESYDVLKEHNIANIKDVAATFPESLATNDYVKSGDGLIEKFDEFKYRTLSIPLEEKWKLAFNRNIEKESELYNTLIEEDIYAVVNLKYSAGEIKIDFDATGGQIVTVTEDYNIFHWVKVLENATTIIMVDSSMTNLVEQLNIDCKKILLTRPNGRLPVLKPGWRII